MSMHPTAIEADRDRQVVIVYKNYRDEVKTYVIIPHAIHFGITVYHKERQWLMNATDVSRNVFRTFAVKDISSWTPSNHTS